MYNEFKNEKSNSRPAIFTESFFGGIARGCIEEAKAPVLLSGADVNGLIAQAPDGTSRPIDLMEIEEGMAVVIPCEECLDMITGESLGYGDSVTVKVITCIGDDNNAVFMTEHGALSTVDFSEIITNEMNRTGVDIQFPDLQELGDIIIGEGIEKGDIEWDR